MVKKHTIDGDYNLYGFYRGVYKYTDCGPTIGFRICDNWVYCDELPGHADVEKGAQYCYNCANADAGVHHATRDYPEEPYLECSLAENEDMARENNIDFDAYELDADYAGKCPCFVYGLIDGISVSSIVEGSDAEVPAIRFYLDDFTEEKFWEAVDEVNEEACQLWKRDNTSWFVIRDENEDWTGNAHWTEFDSELTWEDSGELTQEEKQEIEKRLEDYLEVDEKTKAGKYEIERYDPTW